MMTIRTSYGDLRWPTVIVPEDGVADPGVKAVRPAADPGFDWIAFSRGRVSLEIDQLRIIVPVLGEVVRVIEDCRG